MEEQARGWHRPGPHAWVRVENPCQVNLGLVVGSERALLVDVGAGVRGFERQLAAVREVTDLPLIAAITHDHYDHVLGLAAAEAMGVRESWASSATIQSLSQNGAAVLAQLRAEDGEPETAQAERVAVPTHEVPRGGTSLDLGGVEAHLLPLGHGHAVGDLAVTAGTVLFAGDVLEVGAPPQFEDADPQGWVEALDYLAAVAARRGVTSVVPGHGAVVGPGELLTQRRRLRQAMLLWEARHQEETEEQIAALLPFGPEQSAVLLRRLARA